MTWDLAIAMAVVWGHGLLVGLLIAHERRRPR